MHSEAFMCVFFITIPVNVTLTKPETCEGQNSSLYHVLSLIMVFITAHQCFQSCLSDSYTAIQEPSYHRSIGTLTIEGLLTIQPPLPPEGLIYHTGTPRHVQPCITWTSLYRVPPGTPGYS